jgi:hypothetical protein
MFEFAHNSCKFHLSGTTALGTGAIAHVGFALAEVDRQYCSGSTAPSTGAVLPIQSTNLLPLGNFCLQ